MSKIIKLLAANALFVFAAAMPTFEGSPSSLHNENLYHQESPSKSYSAEISQVLQSPELHPALRALSKYPSFRSEILEILREGAAEPTTDPL